MKRIILITCLVCLLIVVPVSRVEAQVPPTLGSLQPASGCTGEEVVVDGLSGSNDSRVVFYKDNAAKAAVSATPAVPLSPLVSYPPGLQPTSIGFKFRVPDLMSDIYDVRLEHPLMGMSEPKAFKIIANITSIRPNEGNHSAVIEIQGTGFSLDLLRKNEVRLIEGVAVRTFLYPQIVNSTTTPPTLTVPLISGAPIAPSAAYKIGLKVNSIEARFQETVKKDFVLRPHLNFLRPNQGSWQDDILIGGMYFGTDPKNVKIIFRQQGSQTEVPCAQILLENTTLSAKLPAIVGGVYDVAVVANGIESDNKLPFTVYAPVTPTPTATPVPPPIPTPLSTPVTILNLPSTSTPVAIPTSTPIPTQTPTSKSVKPTPANTAPLPRYTLVKPQPQPKASVPYQRETFMIVISLMLGWSIIIIFILLIFRVFKRRSGR